MQKVSFTCDECGVDVTVRLGDDFDDARVEHCPCCGAPVPIDDDYDDE